MENWVSLCIGLSVYRAWPSGHIAIVCMRKQLNVIGTNQNQVIQITWGPFRNGTKRDVASHTN